MTTPMPSDNKELRKLLKGIDKDECEMDGGWWETSTGAEFGAKKLAELEIFIADQCRLARKQERKDVITELLVWVDSENET
jgi:hypothetical protein